MVPNGVGPYADWVSVDETISEKNHFDCDSPLQIVLFMRVGNLCGMSLLKRLPGPGFL